MPASMYGIDLGQLYATQNALMAQRQQQQLNDFALQDAQRRQDYQNALMTAGPDLVSGDPTKVQAAVGKLAPFDPVKALEMARTVKGFNEEDALKRADYTARALNAVAGVPYEQRRQYINALAPQLKAEGIDPNAFNAFDPTDENIAVQVKNTQSIKEQLAQSNADRTFKQNKQTQDETRATAAAAQKETERNHRAMEGIAQQRANIAAQAAATPEVTTPAPIDPESNAITAQTGLSLNGFMYLTGHAAQLQRDKATRNAAAAEAQAFANKNGVDISTLASQYKALNETLEKNIARVNQTKTMEGELQGTLENLKPVADAASLGRLRVANVARLYAGQEFNDPTVQQYAFQLNQLRSELAGYNAALRGNNQPDDKDYREAERVIKTGLDTRAAGGLQTAVQSATNKMNAVMLSGVDRARQGVWDLFGVGKNYKPKYGAPEGSAPQAGAPAGTNKTIRFEDLP